MLTLSFLSYLGFNLDKGSHKNSEAIYPLIKHGLETWSPLENQWELVWGPAIFKFHFALFDDNLMYVVKHKKLKNTYAIAIRGTNPIGVADWLFEDLLVQATVNWPYKTDKSPLKPKISFAVHLGLKALQNMSVVKGLPGEGEDLKSFLRKLSADSAGEPLSIHVTGHSLAGALAPLTALWLKDTQGNCEHAPSEIWDSSNNAHISCTAFAGPSPGDRSFSKYYDKRLGKETERIHNHLDVVPHAWAPSTMKDMLTLYKGTANPDLILKTAYYFFRWSTRWQHYQQIKPKSPAFKGKVRTDIHSFALQMTAQHVLGYLDEFGLTGAIALGILDEAKWDAERKFHLPFPLNQFPINQLIPT